MSVLIKAGHPDSQLAPRCPSHPPGHVASLRSHQVLLMKFLLQGGHNYAKEGKKNQNKTKENALLTESQERRHT